MPTLSAAQRGMGFGGSCNLTHVAADFGAQALLTFQDTGCLAEVTVANPQKTTLNFRLATCDNTSKPFN